MMYTKLKEKQRIEAKILKKHDKPATPYQRLILSDHISKEKKQELTSIYETINPFELKEQIQKKVDIIFKLIGRKVGNDVL